MSRPNDQIHDTTAYSNNEYQKWIINQEGKRLSILDISKGHNFVSSLKNYYTEVSFKYNFFLFFNKVKCSNSFSSLHIANDLFVLNYAIQITTISPTLDHKSIWSKNPGYKIWESIYNGPENNRFL